LTDLTRRSVIALGAILPLAACATVPPGPAEPAAPLTLVEAFQGRTVGRGVFVAPIIRSERRFTAALNGRLDGEVLTVVEDFTYDDGQADRLTWVFTRTGPATWDGRREDTVGIAKAVEEREVIRLTYLADFESQGDVTRLGFSDVIYRGDGGKIINDGIVTRLGLPIGKVRFEIERI
jgi:Protein of unknown function (DUF3833)